MKLLFQGIKFELNYKPNFCRMDAVSEEADPSSYYLALYGLISFLVVMLVVMLLYVACSKKYRLNWFEKNLLETAEATEMRHRWEVFLHR